MAVILDGADLYLVGAVGFDFFDDYFTHSEVLMALAEAGSGADLTIHLNSPGGYTDQAEGIANAIRLRSGKTDVVVAGVCMSAATIIGCAGDELAMSPGSVYMVHEPAITLISANSDGIKSAEKYQRISTDAYAAAYAERTGKSDAEVRAWMKAETYFSAEEAVEAGFADRVAGDAVEITAVAPAFPYADKGLFAHAPRRLVALASKKNWRLPDAKMAAKSAAADRPDKETSMTDKERADALAAELESLKAEMKASKDADETASLQAELKALKEEKEDRERRDAIMALEEADGREEQAKALADAGVAVEAAKKVLAASAKAPADPGSHRLNGAGLNGGGKGGGAQAGASRAAMVANMRKLIGKEAN
ncbi:ATP-dependent Clp protease proteolytic subunit [Afifella sp. H1R]|uniref:Clp protease ClpP n=1 Tax=Afifella sp. H1R TaxID=2908841 RepID=UPI001F1FDDD5|nr:Clp protease ClpP [Afifella sp. H1R]MCF1502917.1 ATP-dependent Clp protease proteolytic subunit [Afifella sp. H1R]